MNKFWTEEEIDYLKENYKRLTYKEIALKLKRTMNSISKKLGRLELENKIKLSTEDEWICKCGKYKDRRAKICKTCWNKLPKSEASNRKRSLTLNGKRKPEGFRIGHEVKQETKDKIRKTKEGEKNYNWKGDFDNKLRRYGRSDWNRLKKEIYKRDNYTCQICENKNDTLHAHHKLDWEKYPELAFNKENIITLCNKCHGKVHTLMRFYKSNHSERGFDRIYTEIKNKLLKNDLVHWNEFN